MNRGCRSRFLNSSFIKSLLKDLTSFPWIRVAFETLSTIIFDKIGRNQYFLARI